jgi:hypothetical protein
MFPQCHRSYGARSAANRSVATLIVSMVLSLSGPSSISPSVLGLCYLYVVVTQRPHADQRIGAM